MSGSSFVARDICCPDDRCKEKCPDFCEDVCLSGIVQRGEFIINVAGGGGQQVAETAFVVTLRVNNCTGKVINNFRPRLQFSVLDPSNGQRRWLQAQHVRGMTASIGYPNRGNNLLVPWNGDTWTSLLQNGVHLPTGSSHFKLYIVVPNWEQMVLLPAVFSANGQVKCCYGNCSKVHKSILLECECLPLMLDQ